MLRLFGGATPSRYWLTRFVFLRLLGIVYFVAFLCLARQFLPLVGHDGLLPADLFLERVRESAEPGSVFWRVPTIFWLSTSDGIFQALAIAGMAGALIVALGFANAPLLAALWATYLSFANVGQLFYGYGWESLLLETGFLAIFTAPTLDPRPFAPRDPPSRITVVLLRWLTFRVMLGAGLIKLRGDPCWRDLTCLVYHYETQPVPNPLSWAIHQLPAWVHAGGVLVNHAAELVAPFFVFGPRRLRLAAGLVIIAFQCLLLLSGNLSWLNWLTIAAAVSCLDDAFLLRALPRGATRLRAAALSLPDTAPSRARTVVLSVLATLVAALSVNPVANMFSPHQRMNEAFDPLSLVNTYGAFGSVGRERYEIVLEGTDEETIDANTRWRAYELPCKPGDPGRRPCVVSPYHLRLDWQMWFAATSDYRRDPWMVHLVYKLLRGDRALLALFANNPFPERAPRFIRAELYRYEFSRWRDDPKIWWRRTYARPYLPPLSVRDRSLHDFLVRHGWQADSSLSEITR